MRVAFTFNVRHLAGGLDAASQEQAEFDEPETIAAIHDAIEANGHDCIDVEADDDCFATLLELKPSIDFVFNIAEGLRGESREAQIPTILEMLDIPYSHSGALTQAIGLDKALTKKVWRFHGLPTPRFVLFGEDLRQHTVEALRFPVLVKPNSEGSSKGLFDGNLIEEPSALMGKVEEIQALIGGSVLVEEFLPGREFTVSVLGNPGYGSGLMALPIAEQDYSAFPPDLQHFASYEVKWFFEDSAAGKDACVCPADLTASLQGELESLAFDAFTTMSARDVARLDIRMDAEGRPQLIEINTLPGMHHDPELTSYLPVSARAAGWDYQRLIGEILDRTIARVKGRAEPGPLFVIPELAPATDATRLISW
jgi:D-alanine-D-alanine ligase